MTEDGDGDADGDDGDGGVDDVKSISSTISGSLSLSTVSFLFCSIVSWFFSSFSFGIDVEILSLLFSLVMIMVSPVSGLQGPPIIIILISFADNFDELYELLALLSLSFNDWDEADDDNDDDDDEEVEVDWMTDVTVTGDDVFDSDKIAIWLSTFILLLLSNIESSAGWFLPSLFVLNGKVSTILQL